MSFDTLGLRPELLKAVETNGYTSPTPVQAKAIPVILNGKDIMARAQTGTGKTDAFALPIVEILGGKKRSGRHPRALILAPTRELAFQVGESIKAYARRVALKSTVVHGGVRINPQIDRLKRGVDILVATPGRLLDLADRGKLKFSRLEFLVFDEADRMLDLGFSEEISEILEMVPAERRTMLFSATYTRQIRNLAAKMLKDPEYIEVSPDNTVAESVVQKVHLVSREEKRALLIHLVTTQNWRRVLVFTRTKQGANKLTEKLAKQGIITAAMHSNKSQSFRTRTLKQFKNGDIRILVATDVAARGLDIIDLPYVVNYDMPNSPEGYVHRIGRTGRAGAGGIAVSLVCHDEKPRLAAIEKLLKQKIPVEKVDGYTEDSDVPDYVLYRPGNTASEKKADKEIVEIVKKREINKRRASDKKRPKTGRKKKAGGGKKKKGSAASFPGRRNKAGKKRTR